MSRRNRTSPFSSITAVVYRIKTGIGAVSLTETGCLPPMAARMRFCVHSGRSRKTQPERGRIFNANASVAEVAPVFIKQLALRSAVHVNAILVGKNKFDQPQRIGKAGLLPNAQPA